MKGITVAAPAKINLTLDVTGKRADGYHDIESVMHQIDLCDQVRVTVTPEGIVVESDREELPPGPGNLAYRAAQAVSSRYGLKTGFRIFIEKNIPLSAGLAGGSTDAAAVVKAIDQLLGLGMNREEMFELGLALGSDVPFCLMGGTALVQGKGEILTGVESRIGLNLVLINPGFPVSTAQVFNLIDHEILTDRPDSGKMIKAMQEGKIDRLIPALGNVMEKVTFKLHPQLEGIKEELLRAGALGALMSGSGPTVFGVFDDEGQARRAVGYLQNIYPYAFCCSSYLGNGRHHG